MTSDRLTRAELLGAATAWGLGAALLAAPQQAVAAAPQARGDLTPNDREAVKFLIDLEFVQLAVYRHAATISVSAPVAAFAREALAREKVHRDILATIQRERNVVANKPYKYAFGASDDATFLALASRVEEAVVQGYNGVIALLEQPVGLSDVIAPIAADEATHAGAVLVLQGKDPVVSPFEKLGRRAVIAPIVSSPEG